MKKQVNADHYEFSKYATVERFYSYWNQVHYTMGFNPSSVLEIGPGPGIVTDVLRKQNVAVTTADFADDVGADVVASVLDLPFEDSAFDVVMCCQVLEHIPYENFSKALSEINRVCKVGAVISLPHSGRYWRYSFYLPGVGAVRFGFNPSGLFPKEHVFNGEHYWEIAKKGYPLQRVEADVRAHFSAVETFRSFDNPFHHFFICKK